jgi:Major Facilitator Superfamily
VPGRGREASARIARQLRDALAALLDQKTPFGRLALTQVVLTAGDTLLTVSLAGSLFFSVSPNEAHKKVILYLLLTMAPFAVVAPLLGPIIDRSRGARRATVIMAGDLQSTLLFPEAFTMLVLSKVYLVTKGSLVPLVVAASERPGGDELASANARLGLLSSLATLAASIPAVGVLELFGGAWVLRLDMVVFVVGTVVALRLPLGRSSRAGWDEHRRPTTESTTAEDAWDEETPMGALGPRANTHPEVILALSAMSILRGLVGFLTFLLAFSLQSHGKASGWYGLMLAASVAGALVGVMAVPRVRKVLSEPAMLAVSIWSVALAGALAAFVGGIVIQALLAFVIGMASAASKPAFDALVQRYVPTAAQGRAFARFETRLQLVWVLGAFLPVVIKLPLTGGDVVIAAVAAVTGLSYLTSRRALRHRWVAP